jgi:hypothetical protein
MATVYRIHPAIGVARVGNSPGDFFVGPERVGERPNPPGGFKDAQCRVKRQAARFRIFAHHDDGTTDEITDADAQIAWTVHLVNKKAANPGRGNTEPAADLTIDPGPRTVAGPNQQQKIDTGQIKFSGAPVTTVPLGEIRTDPQARLVVLGGAGKSASPAGGSLSGDFWASAGWYDDVSDGPVTATIQLRSDSSTPAVEGAWVMVAPPKFAPHLESVITLYDRILDVMVPALLPAPTTTSYTRDVFPILQRARDTQWVDRTQSSHTWSDPVTSDAVRNAIFLKLRASSGGGDMPKISAGTDMNHLTDVQYGHMERWKNNNYTNDWVGPPAPQANVTPDGLDRAALEACVGAAFYPGIEAGGLSDLRPLLNQSNYAAPFRLSHAAVTPGDLTYVMALPWQADFKACGDNWWPVPRPNHVVRGGVLDQDFTGGVAGSAAQMVDNWHALGFVVQQGAQFIEVDRCDLAVINLLTPVLDFQDVPQGPMGMVRETPLAITFEVSSPGAAVTLQYAPGGAPNHPQLVAFNNSVTVGPTPTNGVATARLWIIYRTGTPGSVLPVQTVVVQEAGGTQSWNVTITGNTVARKTAAAALVLDRSGSMSEDRGDGDSKHASLQSAASIFVDVMLEGDGVGLVRFNQDAQVLQGLVPLGAGGLSDVNRGAVKDQINGPGLDPDGQTSIGDGIFEGRNILNSSAATFDVTSLVVLTDGVENRPRMIADVASSINEFTYAVGLGQPQNISVPALQTISGNNGGYLLVTGPIGSDNRFMLQKYFLQILAGISNAETVLDPDGVLTVGQVARVPFQLTEADAGVEVILLSPFVQAVDFRILTPSGQIIEPWRAMSEPGMRFVLSAGVSYYRLALPIDYMPDRYDAGGTWQALLQIGRPRLERSDTRDGIDDRLRGAMAVPAARSLAGLPTGAAAQRASVLAAYAFTASGTSSRQPSMLAAAARRTLPYSVLVHAYSNVSLQARADQRGFEPGATVQLTARLAQSGLPLSGHAQVWADVRTPSGATVTVPMPEIADGRFTAPLEVPVPGVYAARIRANGTTLSGEPFTREKTVTPAVWTGGDRVMEPGGADQGLVDWLEEHDRRLCDLLMCLLRGGAISRELEERLRALGLDLAGATKCLERYCQGSRRD